MHTSYRIRTVFVVLILLCSCQRAMAQDLEDRMAAIPQIQLRLSMPMTWSGQSGTISPGSSGLCCASLDAANTDFGFGSGIGADVYFLEAYRGRILLGASLDIAWSRVAYATVGLEAPRKVYDNGAIADLWERNVMQFEHDEWMLRPAVTARFMRSMFGSGRFIPEITVAIGPEFTVSSTPTASHAVKIEGPQGFTYIDGTTAAMLPPVELKDWNSVKVGLAMDARAAWRAGQFIEAAASLPLSVTVGLGYSAGLGSAMQGSDVSTGAFRVSLGAAWELDIP